MIEPLAALPILVMIAAMAAGRRIQGGGLNWSAWWPRSTALGRLVHALIAGICAWLLTGDPVKAGLVVAGWFAGCSISLLDSIGRDAPWWRGTIRGALQPLPAIVLLMLWAMIADALAPVPPCDGVPLACLLDLIMGLDATFSNAAHRAVLFCLWPLCGALMGPIYRMSWRQGKVEPTVLGEWLTGAAWGAGMILALA